MKRQGRRHYGGKARPAGIPARVGIQESRAQYASFPRHDVFAGYDPEKEEQMRRRALLSQALNGDGIALAELRALRLTHWERGGKVLIQDGELVGVKCTERAEGQASAG